MAGVLPALLEEVAVVVVGGRRRGSGVSGEWLACWG